MVLVGRAGELGSVVKADPEERFGYGLELFLDGARLRLTAATA